MELVIKTLTPLWTGGVDAGKVDRIHETGIIGSLRWWMEAFVRGMGGDVCDPTSEDPQHRCQYGADAHTAILKGGRPKSDALQAGLQDVCTICRIFGCTAWKRRFALSVPNSDDRLIPFWLATLDREGKFNNWWLSQIFKTERVYFGDLTLRIDFMRGYENCEEIIKALLSFMSAYGAIGAKAQYGFGQFAYRGAYPVEQSLRILHKHIVASAKLKNLSGDFYSLQDFWHIQCQIPDTNSQIQRFQRAYAVGDTRAFEQHKSYYLPVSFDIRYKLPGSEDDGLRQAYRLAHGKHKARQVFGTVLGEEQKWGSRVFVSHLYKVNDEQNTYQLRVWGFTKLGVCEDIRSALKAIFEDASVTVTTGKTIISTAENAR